MQTLSNFSEGNAALPEGGTLKARDRLIDKYTSLGGKIFVNSDVKKIIVNGNRASGIQLTNDKVIDADYIVPACNLHYVKEVLLENKYPLNPYNEFDENKELYPTYSFVIASFKMDNIFKKQDIHQVYKVKPYNILGKEYNELQIRHYGYDAAFINKNGQISVQAMITTFEDDYDKIKLLSKEEYLSFKKEVGEVLKDKMREVFDEIELEIVDVLTPLTYQRYVNAYKGTFMTYALGPKMNQVIRKYTLEEIDNVVLANQWLMMPGGTPIAAVNGKFAAQNICYKEDKEYHF